MSKRNESIDLAKVPAAIPAKYTSKVAHAIVRGHLPETALSQRVVEVIQTQVIRGGGESTTWQSYATIRVNGKQVWRGTPGDWETVQPLKLLGGTMTKVPDSGRNQLFILSA